jgi:homoserine O-succinyltransferase
MAGAAFKGTERQFVSLLDRASAGIPIHVSFYALPGLRSSEAGGQHFASHYQGVDALLATQLDGLIVTGREPKMTDLREEPYWHSFTRVLDWARTNTHSTIWSCLAAHAAILHMNGIGRRKSGEKNFGVFTCEQGAGHSLTQGLPPRFRVPHSRWNGVSASDLSAQGYRVLSRIAGDGLDAFIKQEDSLFVFLQGHLEYETDTLMREYRRDVGRYLKGETPSYPVLPTDYFDRETESALLDLRERATQRRSLASLPALVSALQSARIENTWQDTAAHLYGNWLKGIWAQKTEHASRPLAALSAAR